MRVFADDFGRHVGGSAALVGQREALHAGGEPEVHELQVRAVIAAGH